MADEITYESSEDDSNLVSNIAVVRGAPKGLIEWFIAHGWVKSAKQAEQILIGLIVVVVIASIYFFFQSGPKYGHTTPDQAQKGVQYLDYTPTSQ